jgi:hypothetical protein
MLLPIPGSPVAFHGELINRDEWVKSLRVSFNMADIVSWQRSRSGRKSGARFLFKVDDLEFVDVELEDLAPGVTSLVVINDDGIARIDSSSIRRFISQQARSVKMSLDRLIRVSEVTYADGSRARLGAPLTMQNIIRRCCCDVH